MSHKHHDLPLAYPFVPPQRFKERYSDEDAIIRGTLFPELDLPFHEKQIMRRLPETPMTELMKLDFVCLELKLYLDTHPDDARAFEMYREYRRKSADAGSRLFGPQEQFYYNTWVFDPWPWEREEA